MIDRLDKKSKQYLLSLPQVVGIGHGLKEVSGSQTSDEAIMVLVKKKVTANSLPKQMLVPKVFENMPTDVIEVGDLIAHETADRITETDVSIQLSPTSRVRPAPPGVSIGHYRITAGTFGAVVYDKANGQALILSNNHVLANASNGRDFQARIGDAILQPGPADGGRVSRNIIGRLNRFVPLMDRGINQVDCAAAKPDSSNLIVPEILQIGLVNGVTDPVLGMEVKKSGRTTGLTKGQVRAMNVIVNVSYGFNRVLRFEKQILTSPMSSPGDSGSLVLDSNNRAVGLLFAGSDTTTIVNPIRLVLDSLKIRF